jgi:hypothetical protein
MAASGTGGHEARSRARQCDQTRGRRRVDERRSEHQGRWRSGSHRSGWPYMRIRPMSCSGIPGTRGRGSPTVSVSQRPNTVVFRRIGTVSAAVTLGAGLLWGLGVVGAWRALRSGRRDGLGAGLTGGCGRWRRLGRGDERAQRSDRPRAAHSLTRPRLSFQKAGNSRSALRRLSVISLAWTGGPFRTRPGCIPAGFVPLPRLEDRLAVPGPPCSLTQHQEVCFR